MDTSVTGRVVFRAIHDWYEIVERNGELSLGEPWTGQYEEAAALAGIDLSDGESWVAQVEAVAERHSALRPGDYAICRGPGCDVVFVRLD